MWDSATVIAIVLWVNKYSVSILLYLQSAFNHQQTIKVLETCRCFIITSGPRSVTTVGTISQPASRAKNWATEMVSLSVARCLDLRHSLT